MVTRMGDLPTDVVLSVVNEILADDVNVSIGGLREDRTEADCQKASSQWERYANGVPVNDREPSVETNGFAVPAPSMGAHGETADLLCGVTKVAAPRAPPGNLLRFQQLARGDTISVESSDARPYVGLVSSVPPLSTAPPRQLPEAGERLPNSWSGTFKGLDPYKNLPFAFTTGCLDQLVGCPTWKGTQAVGQGKGFTVADRNNAAFEDISSRKVQPPMMQQKPVPAKAFPNPWSRNSATLQHVVSVWGSPHHPKAAMRRGKSGGDNNAATVPAGFASHATSMRGGELGVDNSAVAVPASSAGHATSMRDGELGGNNNAAAVPASSAGHATSMRDGEPGGNDNAAAVPASSTGDGDATAVPAGSAGHAAGTCKPCAHFWKPGGCNKGDDCERCHLCDATAFRRYRDAYIQKLKLARAARRQQTEITS